MLIMKQGSGPEKAVDFKVLVDTLDDHQICLLATLLRHAAEQDYGVVEEFYMWVANRWLDTPDSRKSQVIPEVNERFFTVEAWERYQKEMQGALEAGQKADEAGTLIRMEEHNGHKRS